MTRSKIKIAVVGVGNCASSLIQGLSCYEDLSVRNEDDSFLGLMYPEVGGFAPSDIEPVLAFDIDERKVGKPLEEAIFSLPNCTMRLAAKVRKSDVCVEMGNPLDGISGHMMDFPEKNRFVLAKKEAPDLFQVIKRLKESGAEILVNYLPVGSQKATEFYAEACLESRVSLLNCMPVFIASNPSWSRRFLKKKIPIVGDDVKSQLGATITHRVLAKLFGDRGVTLDRTYQLNMGGNTDFLNMLNRERLQSKKISKTEAVQSQLEKKLPSENIHIGPSDYVPWQKDNKICYIRMEGRGFAGAPVNVEMRLSVEDSPNSAGVVIDVIRCLKLARDHQLRGPLEAVSAYYMKHPPQQMSDEQAKNAVAKFIEDLGTAKTIKEEALRPVAVQGGDKCRDMDESSDY